MRGRLVTRGGAVTMLSSRLSFKNPAETEGTLRACVERPGPPGVLNKRSLLILAPRVFSPLRVFPQTLEWIVELLGSLAAKRRRCRRTCSHLNAVPAQRDIGLIRKRKHRPPASSLASLLSLHLLPSVCFSSSRFQKSQTRWF